MAGVRTTDAFEDGSHFLLTPFLSTICPLLRALEEGEPHRVNEVLRRESPAFAIDGENASRSLRQMLEASKATIDDLHERWTTQTVGEILRHSAKTRLVRVSDRLREHLAREPRAEEYDEALHAQEKGDWLADAFFAMKPDAIGPYAMYVLENFAFSTQHGVKGEEYGRPDFWLFQIVGMPLQNLQPPEGGRRGLGEKARRDRVQERVVAMRQQGHSAKPSRTVSSLTGAPTTFKNHGRTTSTNRRGAASTTFSKSCRERACSLLYGAASSSAPSRSTAGPISL